LGSRFKGARRRPLRGSSSARKDGAPTGRPTLAPWRSRAAAIAPLDRKRATSTIQRRRSVGYNKAASLVERMEEEGVVGPANHAGKREILVGETVDRRTLGGGDDA
jgi:DNA segregation ATPase FtsK/SpoIIIE-like protein